MKNDKKEKKVYSIEELAQFINTSPKMKRQPKRPISLLTKYIFCILLVALGIFVYFNYIYVPYVFTVAFTPKEYVINGRAFVTKNTNEVVFENNDYIKLSENISNIMPFKDYSNLDKNYAVFLSEYGNLYLYDMDEKNVIPYYNGDKKVAKLEEKKLDIYTALEVTFEDLSKGIIGKSSIYYKGVDDVKIMDSIIYENDGIYVYTTYGKLCMARYSDIPHFDILNYTMFTSSKAVTSFYNEANELIKIKEIKINEDNNDVYFYIINEVGKLLVFKLNLDKFDDYTSVITLKEIAFNFELEKFEDAKELGRGVRIKIKGENRYLDVIEDKIIYGSLSNELACIAYLTDIYNPSKYIISNSTYGNNKYKDKYYTLNTDKEIVLAYLNLHSELMITNISLDGKKEYTKKVKLKDNQSVDKMYLENVDVFISIKETTKTDYVVFENETIEEYRTYKLEEFLKGVEYYE